MRIKCLAKSIIAIFVMRAMAVTAQAAVLKSGLLEINISEKGYYTSVKVDGKELIAAPDYALVTACAGGKLLTPIKMRANCKALELTMSDGGRIWLQCSETPNCVVFEVTKAPTTYDADWFWAAPQQPKK